MALLKYKYYQLLERETQYVSIIWKVLHLLIFLLIVLSGFITAFAFGKALGSFGNLCILHANLKFDMYYEPTKWTIPDPTRPNNTEDVTTEISPDQNVTETTVYNYKSAEVLPNSTNKPRNQVFVNSFRQINIAKSRWGKIHLCNFCHFTPVIAMILGIVMGAFILISSKGGQGYASELIPSPWRMVYPYIFTCVIISIFTLVTMLEMTTGFDHFCAQFVKYTKSTSCTEIIDDYTAQFNVYRKSFYGYYKAASTASYVLFCGWISQCVLFVVRILCLVDFQMYIVTVKEKSKVGDEESDITKPENSSEDLEAVTQV